MIRCDNLSFSYNKKSLVLDNVSLNVERGDFVVLLGPNGNGKTTLLKCLDRLLKVEKGRVFVNGKDITEYSSRELSKRVGYVPQILEFADMSVFDAVLMGRTPHITFNPTKKDLQIVSDIIERFALEDISSRNVNGLSGGERQKVAIARLIATRPDVLLFDEPTSNLDVKNQYEAMELIKNVKKYGHTVVVSMHDINLALEYGEKFVLIKDGKILSQTDKNGLSEQVVSELFDINVKFVRDGDKIAVVCNKEENE